MPMGPHSDNSWTINSVDVRDYCPPALNKIWQLATRVWDTAATGIKFNYQNRQHRECEDVDWEVGAIVICSKNNERYPEAWANIDTDHNEITKARIWLGFQTYQDGDEETAVHEFGHAIGFHHFSGVDSAGKPLSIMHPDLYVGRAALLPLDIQTLQKMGYMSASSGVHKTKHRRKRGT